MMVGGWVWNLANTRGVRRVFWGRPLGLGAPRTSDLGPRTRTSELGIGMRAAPRGAEEKEEKKSDVPTYLPFFEIF
jgi:hypothetical protein